MIVVFDCNPQHYFHKTCGLDWFDLKTECPLCRKDFTEEIMKHVITNDRKLIKKLSSAQDPQDAEEEKRVDEADNEAVELMR